MNQRFLRAFKRHETYVASVLIAFFFVATMTVVAWMMRSSMVAQPYETLSERDLKRVFATGYLRFREDDGSPYLKVELHNGTLWWIKDVEFDFDGSRYSLKDADAFRPLHFGAVRCVLKKSPSSRERIEYDITVLKAAGHPPAQVELERKAEKIAGGSQPRGSRN
jgi:hypothetical protein